MSNSKFVFTILFYLLYTPIFSQNETNQNITKIEFVLNNFFVIINNKILCSCVM